MTLVSRRLMRRFNMGAAVVASILALTAPLLAQENLAHVIIGGESTYTVRHGDSLRLIGARFGVSPWTLSSINMINPQAPLRIGQKLKIANRHIVPAVVADGILVNVPQRMLYLLSVGDLISAYPLAVGRPEPKWRTPTMAFTIAGLDENPVWLVPKSIQEEMEEEGKEVETRVDAGPHNPLGRFRIKLSLPGYAIHSTISPASVYSFQTHGCMRLFPANAEAFFGQVRVGMRGRIIYQPVLLARLANGRVFAEVNRDIYGMSGDPMEILHAIADSHKLDNMIDWSAAQIVVDRHEGIARDITAGAAKP
jgi:L,D-transpeptidase ErfK/SrfK